MDLRVWLEKQAPDFLSTWQRFPLAIILAALNTALIIGKINEVVWLRDEVWARASLGLATGATLAVAGVYFAESRPEQRLWGILLKLVLPFAAIAAFQITDVIWFVPWALPAIAILWLSVSPFTRIERGAPREEQQHRFWWINHQAVTTAVIGGVGFLLVALGLFAIERSLSVLFGLSTSDLFYKWVLPFAGLFLTPVYWLSTLSRLSSFSPEALEKPEFLSRAVGFLGQFVLVPLLLIYSLILLAYTVQIAVTQHLPQGMIGWMVLGFVVIGAATWLILHPPFMRDRALVRFFRRWWFWLTLVPLGLFFVAVYVRVDAYGFTSERMLLLAGGVWAIVLAGVFLLRRGDIRLIPALAGAILLLMSVGPWNYANLPIVQQLTRLDALLSQPGKGGASFPPNWTPEQAEAARGAIGYLDFPEIARARLVEVLRRHGLEYSGNYANAADEIVAQLGYSRSGQAGPRQFSKTRVEKRRPIDLTATPLLLDGLYVIGTAGAEVSFFDGAASDEIKLTFRLDSGSLEISDGTSARVTVSLGEWARRQNATWLVDPWIDFAIGGRGFRYALERVDFEAAPGVEVPKPIWLQGTLFASSPTPSP